LWRHGAHVTLVHRGDAMHHHVKYWILPDINNRIKNGEVTAHFSSSVGSIAEDSVELITPKGTITTDNDYVFALTGYHPDFDFLTALGIRTEGEDRCPACDPQSLESNIPGLYLAGVIVAGMRTNEIFIENGRFHGRQIAQDIAAKLAGRAPVKVG
jgi:thioredoxin reductase (NADPH)